MTHLSSETIHNRMANLTHWSAKCAGVFLNSYLYFAFVDTAVFDNILNWTIELCYDDTWLY